MFDEENKNINDNHKIIFYNFKFKYLLILIMNKFLFLILILVIILVIITIYFYLKGHSIENFNNRKSFPVDVVYISAGSIEDFSNKTPFPIDIVYTWAGEDISDNIRISNNNELKYSLRSVYKYAPWVNHIYILMNPPKRKPSWFNNNYNKLITIVDQTETFPKNSVLPNTNSNAIETTLHNIKGLSEHFIYFNDDCFLGDHVQYTDFFTKEGKPKIQSTVKQFDDLSQYKTGTLSIKYPKMIEYSKQYFYDHIPIPFLKSYIVKFHKEYPDYINWIRTYKSRKGLGCDMCSKYNLGCPCQAIQYTIAKYMYDDNMVELDNIYYCYFNGDNINELERFKDKPCKFFCINDTETNILKRQNVQNRMNIFFKSFYCEIPFFEKKN